MVGGGGGGNTLLRSVQLLVLHYFSGSFVFFFLNEHETFNFLFHVLQKILKDGNIFLDPFYQCSQFIECIC